MIDLDELITCFGQGISIWSSKSNPGPLACCRLGDACRDQKLKPVTESEFQNAWKSFDEAQQFRFCLSLDSLDLEAASNQLSTISTSNQGTAALQVIQRLATDLSFLTAEVLEQSDVRLEEFARQFCAAWKLSIKDEKDAVSSARLHEIDFGRLMKEADAARNSADERLAYLKKLQDEQEEQRRPRRGKW